MTHLEKLLKQRDELLASNPKLAAFQAEIDLKLAHLTDTGDRMAVILAMTKERLDEQKRQLSNLTNNLLTKKGM